MLCRSCNRPIEYVTAALSQPNWTELPAFLREKPTVAAE